MILLVIKLGWNPREFYLYSVWFHYYVIYCICESKCVIRMKSGTEMCIFSYIIRVQSQTVPKYMFILQDHIELKCIYIFDTLKFCIFSWIDIWKSIARYIYVHVDTFFYTIRLKKFKFSYIKIKFALSYCFLDIFCYVNLFLNHTFSIKHHYTCLL